jgi:hypothetical protein
MGSKNQIRNNKISRNKKNLSSRCLVLGQVDSVFGHPSGCISRTRCLSRRGVMYLSGSKGAATRSSSKERRSKDKKISLDYLVD